MKKSIVNVALVALGAAPAAFATQGVSKTEIVIGTSQDLSGPIVPFSKQAVNGMRMRVDEINAQGGINGRKLKLVVEDHGYDPKKAVLAAQKMVQRDKVFASIGSIGTPTAVASMPIFLDKDVLFLFPLSAARQMYEPLHKLKFSFAAPYYDQMRAGLKRLVKDKGHKTVCALYQDDDFGKEVFGGGEHGLKDIGMQYAEVTTFKRGATDFSSQVAKLKGAGCQAVVMGTIIRETIGTLVTARKLGLNADFIGTTASYTHLIHALGKGAVEGFYSACTINYPYADDPSKNVRDWMAAYKKKFGTDGDIFAVYGYNMIGMFATAAEKSGANLTAQGFAATLEKTTYPRDMFGGDEQSFSPTKHLGSNRAKLCQIQGGKWRSLTDYITE
jgi:branched-chain amino acid transport system substrate-binding protein